MTTSRIRDKHLSCSICFELYTRPKTLPCLHSFCEVCLENHILAKKTERSFGCPMCNTVIELPDPSAPPHQWASQFKTDFKLQGMLEEILNIEQERKTVKDISHLALVIEGLRENEQMLIDKIEEDKLSMSTVGNDQEELSQQIADVFATIHLKLRRKEDAMKQRLNQLSVQRTDSISRSWLHKQKLVDQANALIRDADNLLATGSKDRRKEIQRFQDSHSSFKISFGNLNDVQFPKLELDMRQVDILKLDTLKFCDIYSEKEVSASPLPPATNVGKRPAPPIPTDITSSRSDVRLSPGQAPPTAAVKVQSVESQKPHLIAILTPVKAEADKEPELQDVIVLRESNVQLVATADSANKKIIVIYIQQGGKTQKSLKLDATPVRLCKLDNAKIAVSMNNPYKVIILGIYPDLKVIAHVKTNINNIGITALNANTIALSAKNKISVITVTGVIIKEFHIKVESSYHAMSWYVTTTPTGSIIVADKHGEMVSCLTPTGQTLWQWKAPDSTPPYGVACDGQGRIHVVLGALKQVRRLSETGQPLGVALDQENGLDQPSGMAIDQFGQWYVLKRSRQIQIFKW